MEVARRSGAAILSVDSMMVYRGMDIGTAKPTPADRAEVVHGMIDVADPTIDYTVSRFQSEARLFLARFERVVIVGGSGLHFRSVVDPLSFPPHDPSVRREVDALERDAAVERLLALDPLAGSVLDLKNPRRVERALEIALISGEVPSVRHASTESVAVRSYDPLFPFTGVGVDPSPALEGRIIERVATMMDSGLLAEVSTLAPTLGRNARQAVGYKEMMDHLEGAVTLEQATSNVITATTALARRQRTYFRRDPRLGWVAPDVDFETTVSYCLDQWT